MPVELVRLYCCVHKGTEQLQTSFDASSLTRRRFLRGPLTHRLVMGGWETTFVDSNVNSKTFGCGSSLTVPSGCGFDTNFDLTFDLPSLSLILIIAVSGIEDNDDDKDESAAGNRNGSEGEKGESREAIDDKEQESRGEKREGEE